MTDQFADWDHEPNGDISVRPMMGWAMATVPMGLIARVLYADEIAAIDQWRPKSLQLHMNASQAREFAQALLRNADLVDAQSPDTPPQ